MKKTGLLLLFFYCHCLLFGQSAPAFSPAAMRADVDTLIGHLEGAHPNPYYRYPKTRFYKEVEKVKRSFDKPLDAVDFYLAVQPLLAKLEDGHTDLKIPMALYESGNPFVLPYKFKLSPVKPYIRFVRPYRSITAELPQGAEVISINGVPAKKIVADVINLTTGETAAFRAEFGGSNYFELYLEKLYKANGVYKIRYTPGKEVKTVTIKGIRQQVLNAQLQRYNDSVERVQPAQDVYYTLQLLPNDKAAVMNLLEFNDLEAFKVFADSAFRVLQEKGVEHLIIDLRENGGGDSDIGDELCQYLARAPFRQYDKVVGKHSRLLKERLQAHRVNRSMDSADMALMNTPNGVFETEVYEDIPLRENPLRFKGPVYLLTSAYTFSSAADFAQCFKHYKMGTVVGEETGGLIVSYGDIVQAKLPNTQLGLTVSCKLYYNIGSKAGDWRGVIPDKVIPSGQALEAVLGQIGGRER